MPTKSASCPRPQSARSFLSVTALSYGAIMRTCSSVHGRRSSLGIRGVVLAVAVTSSALTAQSQAPAPVPGVTNVASDPDVLGAERLFSAWMDGQIAYRGLPGIVVGVVSDQQLVWAR